MNDTSPEVARIFHGLMMDRNSEERFLMGSDMFDAAREVVVASLATAGPSHLRASLFLRLYGSDFDAAERTRILTVIAKLDPSPA